MIHMSFFHLFPGHKVTGARAVTGASSVKRKTSAPASGSDPRTARSFTPEPQSSQALPQQRSVHIMALNFNLKF